MKKFMTVAFLVYAMLMWGICVTHIILSVYQIFKGGISNVYEADWLLVEIPFVIVGMQFYGTLGGRKGWIYKYINE